MIKNNATEKEKGIKKIALLSSTIIILIVSMIIGIILIKTEYSNFRTHMKNFRNTLIEREMFAIKTSLENLKSDIDFEEISIINSKKQRIKNQSIIAYNLALSIYNNSKHLSNDEKIELIKTSIRNISQKENDIHYFIFDKKGTLLLSTSNPNNEGINFTDYEDVNGVKFINKILSSPIGSQNYIEYYGFQLKKRINYSQHLEELGLIIGSASFLEKTDEDLKNKLLEKIALKNFNQDEFIFIYKINGLNNIKENNSLLIEKNITTYTNEIEAMEEILKKTNYIGNDFLYYSNYQKLLYGTYLTNLRYFIGIGINLSYIDKIVEKEKEISLDNMYSKIIKLMVIIGIITIIFFIFSLLFTKKIESIFMEYRKNVIEQDKLLIQKSKMASMGEMIGNIAHQWRQPLSQLSGLFFDIESAYDYKELNKKYLQNRVEEANDLLEYMSKTIDDFRNFFNPNSKKEEFYLKDAVENAIKIVKSTLNYYQIELTINIDENHKIEGYKNEYSQAVMNIITNAKDVIKERNIKNPQIKIYSQKREKLYLHIEDNAGGVDENIIEKIFDPYFTTKYEYGTGIGLYMTKLIVEDKMNGNIKVKNSKDGAVFTIET